MHDNFACTALTRGCSSKIRAPEPEEEVSQGRRLPTHGGDMLKNFSNVKREFCCSFMQYMKSSSGAKEQKISVLIFHSSARHHFSPQKELAFQRLSGYFARAKKDCISKFAKFLSSSPIKI